MRGHGLRRALLTDPGGRFSRTGIFTATRSFARPLADQASSVVLAALVSEADDVALVAPWLASESNTYPTSIKSAANA